MYTPAKIEKMYTLKNMKYIQSAPEKNNNILCIPSFPITTKLIFLTTVLCINERE